MVASFLCMIKDEIVRDFETKAVALPLAYVLSVASTHSALIWLHDAACEIGRYRYTKFGL